MQRSTLSAPAKLLPDHGPNIQSLRRDNGLKTLQSPDVDTLIAMAVVQRGWTLDTRAKGELIIMSVSLKRRSRRP